MGVVQFEEILQEFTPFEGNLLFKIENQNIYVALAYVIKQKQLERFHINTIEEYRVYFDEETIISA
ncbi:hypothetical protein [Bacillus rhizoplanae]|uniref:hypothetical protein n=1 Tax=Bacillus rhizoplanae TaxID=2880966 RepID=UPI003D1E88AD